MPEAGRDRSRGRQKKQPEAGRSREIQKKGEPAKLKLTHLHGVC